MTTKTMNAKDLTAKNEQAASVAITIVGSVGIDTIETPRDKREEILGGSASYACAAASFFSQTGMVGVVGSDFPKNYRNAYEDFGIDLKGLQTQEGKTFRWSGVYAENMDHRDTISTDLNVFANFSPKLPSAYLNTPYLLLGNIAPALQLHVLAQLERPKFSVVDTMDLWINSAPDELKAVIGKIDMLTLNESEARHLTGAHNLIRAARALLDLGPTYVLIKKGEHGSMLFSENRIFLMPAFPLQEVVDPTGAGDTFAGGFIGALAASGDISEAAIRKAMVYGSVVAAFGVEKFSLERLQEINSEEIEERAYLFREMLRIK